MLGKMNENNQVSMIGEIISEFRFRRKVLGEAFYVFDVRIKRFSESTDCIPVMVSEKMMDVTRDYRGQCVRVTGQYRSYNIYKEQKSHLVLYVFAQKITFVEEEERQNQNQIFLDGYICKHPIYRKTPLGREISEIIMSVDRAYGKPDYIPCICWGRSARLSDGLEVGRRIRIGGRIQSREYRKRISGREYETRVAYEVSISEMEVMENE